MTPPLDVVRRLLSGDPDAANGLLGACRVHAYGAEAFGGTMACELFVRQPAPLSREPHVVATGEALAVFDVDGQGHEQAVFSDLYDGRIGRLWRLGAGDTAAEAEPALFLPGDAMMSQVRDPVAFSPGDHPDLDPGAVPALIALAASLARIGPDGETAAVDGRALVVRAFTEGDRGAALLVLDQSSGAVHRIRRQVQVAVAFRFSGEALTHSLVVFDRVPQPPRRQHLVGPARDTLQGTA